MGLIGYYRKFVQGYGQIAGALTQLLKKDATYGMKRLTGLFNS